MLPASPSESQPAASASPSFLSTDRLEMKAVYWGKWSVVLCYPLNREANKKLKQEDFEAQSITQRMSLGVNNKSPAVGRVVLYINSRGLKESLRRTCVLHMRVRSDAQQIHWMLAGLWGAPRGHLLLAVCFCTPEALKCAQWTWTFAEMKVPHLCASVAFFIQSQHKAMAFLKTLVKWINCCLPCTPGCGKLMGMLT